MSARARKGCPICGAPATARYRPFCSRRCADLDLHRWMTGQYAVPVVELDEDELDAIEREAEGAGGDPEDASGEDQGPR